MAWEPTGEYGLRWRVRMAYRGLGTFAAVAAALGVGAEVIEGYLTDPYYVPSPADQETIVANLGGLPTVRDEARILAQGYPTYDQMPLWDQDAVDGLVPPTDATAFKVTWYAPYADGGLRSSQVYTLPGNDPATVIDTLMGDNLDLLNSVVWYT